MTEQYVSLMTTLGIIIVIILLLVILPILMSIRRKQKDIIDNLESVVKAIVNLNNNITAIEELVNSNFKEVLSKSIVLDSKQTSIKDSIEIITKGLEVHHTETINAINTIDQNRFKRLRNNNKSAEGNNTSSE